MERDAMAAGASVEHIKGSEGYVCLCAADGGEE